MKHLQTTLITILTILCLFTYVISRVSLQKRIEIIASEKNIRPNLSSLATRLFSLEFDGLLADYFLLKIGAYASREKKSKPLDYDGIYAALQQIYTLDPYFQQNYMITQGILPWNNKVTEANYLLGISANHRSWDWRPDYYAGTNYFYFLNDYAKAGKYFLKAGKIQGSPILLALLGARFSARVGKSNYAIKLLLEMLDNINHEKGITGEEKKQRTEELKNRIIALKKTTYLDEKIRKFKKLKGRLPFALEELVTSGIINKLPINSYSIPFYYNWQTGKISLGL